MSLTGFISYKRVGWTGQTPWNPTNLNIMDKGIKDNNDMIANLRSEVSALNSNITLYTLINNAITLYSDSDLNKLTTSGLYYLFDASNVQNAPNEYVTNSYVLVFAKTDKRVTQIILPGNDEYIYYRSTFTDNELWKKWKQAGGLS